MATVIDALVVKLGLDPSGFQKGRVDSKTALDDMRRDVAETENAIAALEAKARRQKQQGAGEERAIERKIAFERRTTVDATSSEHVRAVKALQGELTAKKAANKEAQRLTAGEILEQRKILETKQQAAKKTDKVSRDQQQDTRKRVQQTREEGTAVQALTTKVIGLFAAFTAGEGLASFLKNTIEGAAATGRLAANLGVDIEALGAWEGAVKRVGGSAADADGALASLVKTRELLAAGQLPGDQAKVLNSFGITAQDLADPIAALEKLSARAGTMSKAQFSLRLGMLGFDQNAINAMSGGREELRSLMDEARRAGVTTQAMADKSAKAQRAWENMKAASAKLGQNIAEVLAPAIETIATWLGRLAEWAQRHPRAFAVAVGVMTAALMLLAAMSFVSLIASMAAVFTGGTTLAGLSLAPLIGSLGAVAAFAAPLLAVAGAIAAIGIMAEKHKFSWSDFFTVHRGKPDKPENPADKEPWWTMFVPRVGNKLPATPTTSDGGAASGDVISDYMARTRRAESGGRDNAKNPRSTATGRYQFTTGTWLATYRAEFGRTGESKEQILAKRHDGETQEKLMRRLTSDNAAGLRAAGLPVNNDNLYLAHFAGIAGAVKLLKNPNASAESLLGPKAIAANPFLRGKTGAGVAQWAQNTINRRSGGPLPAPAQPTMWARAKQTVQTALAPTRPAARTAEAPVAGVAPPRTAEAPAAGVAPAAVTIRAPAAGSIGEAATMLLSAAQALLAAAGAMRGNPHVASSYDRGLNVGAGGSYSRQTIANDNSKRVEAATHIGSIHVQAGRDGQAIAGGLERALRARSMAYNAASGLF